MADNIFIKEKGVYRTPILYMIDSRNNVRTWKAIIDGHKWYTVSGLQNGKQTTSEPKIVKSGKNIGKKNETTIEMQIRLDVESEYNKKIKTGYKTSLDLYTKIPFPMALHDVNKGKNWGKITYPVYIQPKYDGTLFMVDIKNNIGYTRGRKVYIGNDHILNELKGVDFDGFLVGELWKEGYNLQDISGASRKLIDKDGIKLEYWVFDLFTTDENQKSFEDRILMLDKVFGQIPDAEYVKRVPTKLMKDKKHVEAEYKKYLENGYEGAVLRLPSSLYEWSFNKEKRSYGTMKWKPRFDAEYKIVDITEGSKGKEIGAVIFVLKAGKHTFNATPNWPYDVRKQVYTNLRDKKKCVIGLEMVVQYSILSANGVPQQPKVLNFRKENTLEYILKEDWEKLC